MVLADVDVNNSGGGTDNQTAIIFGMWTRRGYQVMPICIQVKVCTYLYPNDKRSESKFPILIIGARELGNSVEC